MLNEPLPLDPIPLDDAEPSSTKIVFQGDVGALGAATVRSKRASVRKACGDVHVCLTIEMSLGRSEHVECPVIDMSSGGFAIEFDRQVAAGTQGYIAYWTVSHRPVRLSCCVKRCSVLPNGRFCLGLKLNRRLDYEERRPAKTRPGREVALGMRPRKLRPLRESPPEQSAQPEPSDQATPAGPTSPPASPEAQIGRPCPSDAAAAAPVDQQIDPPPLDVLFDDATETS